jgi:hypothetical protein
MSVIKCLRFLLLLVVVLLLLLLLLSIIKVKLGLVEVLIVGVGAARLSDTRVGIGPDHQVVGLGREVAVWMGLGDGRVQRRQV